VYARGFARAHSSCFEGDQVSVALCPTIRVQQHNSANFLTACRMWTKLHRNGEVKALISINIKPWIINT
jgi:hypothetical protein